MIGASAGTVGRGAPVASREPVADSPEELFCGAWTPECRGMSPQPRRIRACRRRSLWWCEGDAHSKRPVAQADRQRTAWGDDLAVNLARELGVGPDLYLMSLVVLEIPAAGQPATDH